ncbi:MAG TPA: tetratricopeptide repeat protein [Verrucomicrobiae bacterium]|nr:tetratricopeptide repeat protein [Verrucomicrobiae bacterium]
MRFLILPAVCCAVLAQTPDPAYGNLARAYESLTARDYESAVTSFQAAIHAAPDRASIHKDLGYTYLKIGENELARAQFHEAMRLDAADTPVALEYAFLCYEGKDKLEARRIFDRLRKTGNPTAEQAFQNIDAPLAAGIARWREAIDKGADDSGSHYELATLAEQRDSLELAAEQFRLAWQRRPERREILVDLGRVLQELDRNEEAMAVLLAASRSGDTRTADMARERMPHRYPYVAEFRAAAGLDPQNVNLRRELAYLLLEMGRSAEAEKEFRALADPPMNDLLSAAQLGFLLYGRGEKEAAKVLLDRVLAGSDTDLANRVRAVMGVQQVGHAAGGGDAKQMAENSLRAGYLKDALAYLKQAHADDPSDMELVLKLGQTANILHEDREAFRWFNQARQGEDPAVASAADQAWRNLRQSEEPVRYSGWIFPMVSTRWNDLFGYAQVRTELNTHTWIRPYVSIRLDADSRSCSRIPDLLYSETSIILAAGLRTSTWHGVSGWFEAGWAANYLNGHMLTDYRGGVSMARAAGRSLVGERSGAFGEVNADAVFISRFGNDFLVYSQSRAGYSMGPKSMRSQLFWSGNLTFDSGRQVWANFMETGLGVKVHAAFMPDSMYVILTAVRGAYLFQDFNPLHRPYTDLKAGVWYAFAR